MSDAMLAGIELGGTKCLAVRARGGHIVEQIGMPTGAPDETLGALDAILARWHAEHRLQAIGIASFGPLARTAGGGFTGIADTPKPGWSHRPLATRFADALHLPVLLDTDVAGAALAEWRWGGRKGAGTIVYLTIGTGIGGALLVAGKPIGGTTHSELGHVRVRRPAGDGFAGICPFHGDCLEGIASGPAIAARAGRPAPELPADHPAWGMVADAVAELAATLILTAAPDHILIGGGVGTAPAFPLATVRRATLAKLAGYGPPLDGDAMARLIDRATLGARAGPLGAIALAQRARADGAGGDLRP